MKHTAKLLLIPLIFLSFLLFSCEKKTLSEEKENPFYHENKTYEVEIQMGEQNERIQFHKKDGILHLTYPDADSPLYEMEHIISSDKQITKFQGLNYESSVIMGNAKLLYEILEILNDKKAFFTKKEKEWITKNYQSDEINFTIKEKRDSPLISEISGEFQEKNFTIIFINQT